MKIIRLESRIELESWVCPCGVEFSVVMATRDKEGYLNYTWTWGNDSIPPYCPKCGKKLPKDTK